MIECLDKAFRPRSILFMESRSDKASVCLSVCLLEFKSLKLFILICQYVVFLLSATTYAVCLCLSVVCLFLSVIVVCLSVRFFRVYTVSSIV